MTQFLSPAVNVGDPQSLNLESNANSDVTSSMVVNVYTASDTMWSDLESDLDVGLLAVRKTLVRLNYPPLCVRKLFLIVGPCSVHICEGPCLACSIIFTLFPFSQKCEFCIKFDSS